MAEWASPSSLHTTLEGLTKYVNTRWMQSLHGFLHGIQWIMFHGHLDYCQNHLLEVGLTQNQKTVALQTFPTIDLFSFIMGRGPTWMKFIDIAFGWGPGHIWLHTTSEGPWPHHTTWFWRCLGTAFGHFILGAHNFMVMAFGSCVSDP